METRSKMINRNQAAELLGVTTRTLKRWAVAGRIRQHRDSENGRVWFDLAEMEAVRRKGQNGH